ncbi:MAG: sulfite exporter TauE/SafE family protein [Acidimicrobiales bacterium]
MDLSLLDYLAAGGAALAAGAVNALAGGGTLISFPTLIALGVPAVAANVTSTVALCPGYLAGTHAQRDDLAAQSHRLRRLAAAAAAGGLAGSVLLIFTPDRAFRAVVPYLILLSCGLLASGERVRTWVRPAGGAGEPVAAPAPSIGLCIAVAGAALYGGFFGAGLGIMVLAVLALWSDDSLVRLNALKQALSLVINVVAAVVFAFSGHVRWELVPVMAVTSLIGGNLGGRFSRRVNQDLLRHLVVLAGVGVAISLWVS